MKLENRNYLELVFPSYSSPNFSIDERQDPDAICKQLYDDMWEVFFQDRTLPNGSKPIRRSLRFREGVSKDEQPWEQWELQISCDGMLYGLGVDFIGPSTYWAQKAGVSDQDIKDSLSVTRRLAGHLIWPRWIRKEDGTFNQDDRCGKHISIYRSINKARGGEKGLYDRIDYTLYSVQNWYHNRESKLSKTLDKNKEWLILFEDFDGFCDFFFLRSFLDSNASQRNFIRDFSKQNAQLLPDNVLASEDIGIPSNADDYLRFMKRHEEAIVARGKMMFAV